MNAPTLFAVTAPQIADPITSLPMSAEDSIVFMARVSSPNQRTEDSAKLLTYLVTHGHWSPFDMVDMTCEIHTSRAIMAQILRHWSFRFQEFSQRYAEVSSIDWSHVEMRTKGSTNRQGSLEVSQGWTDCANGACKVMENTYQVLLGAGVAPESARMLLPLATPTRAYMKGSVRSWMTYFWQRCDPHAQKEHRLLAEQLFEIFCTQFPIIGKLVQDYKPQIVPR